MSAGSFVVMKPLRGLSSDHRCLPAETAAEAKPLVPRTLAACQISLISCSLLLLVKRSKDSLAKAMEDFRNIDLAYCSIAQAAAHLIKPSMKHGDAKCEQNFQ